MSGVIGRVGIGQELDCRRIGIVGRAELDGVISALRRDAVGIGSLLERADLGVVGEDRDSRCR